MWSSEHKAKSFSEMSDAPHFWCDVCQVQFADQPTMDKHLAGTEHTLKQIRGENQQFCFIIMLLFNNCARRIGQVDKRDEMVESRDDGSVFCNVCKVECNTMAVSRN